MTLWTIGFAGKSAERFFGALRAAGTQRLVDVRRRNASQLAGFTKRSDLPWFLRELCACDYVHEPLLAPTDELLDGIRGGTISWEEYERRFLALLAERRVEELVPRALFEPRTVLLCTEPTTEHCHRRLVVEYLASHWGEITRIDLG